MSLDTKTVLFAWELGEGLGHLPPLKAIAKALTQEGAKAIFALRDPVLTRTVLADIGSAILPAPFWPTPTVPPVSSGTYADILIANGYASPANICALVRAWDEILDLAKPDLIVCEHAPGAALAALGRIPVAFVGNGFVVPPADGPEFPPYEAAKGETGRQRPVFAAIQGAFEALGRKAPQTICEPFRGAFRGIYVFPELDTYRQVRREPVLGPIEPMPRLCEPPAKRRLFAYSAADYALADELMRGLMDIGAQAGAYFRGSLGSRAAVLRSRGVTVYDDAPSLLTVLPEAGVVFSHGGTGLTNAALAAGRPHIVNPRHFEALMTARRLEELNVGITMQAFEAKRFREAVNRANDDATMRDAALKKGAAAQEFMNRAKPLENTVAALHRILR